MGLIVLPLIEVLVLLFIAMKLFHLLRSDESSELAVPMSTTVVFRLIGVLNIASCAVGIYWMLQAVVREQQRSNPHNAQYFWAAFITLTLINAVLIAGLAFTSVRLIRCTKNAALAYCAFIGVYLIYGILNGGLWLAPDPIGSSIAAASGVGNMGIAPFELLLFPIRGWMLPYVYPLASAACVFVLHRVVGRQRASAV